VRPAAVGVDRPLRPAPVLTADTAFFWEGAATGRLLIQACDACGELCHPPAPLCPECHSTARVTRQMSGRGRVASYIIVHHPPNPWFELPIAVVTVELDEGPRVISNLCEVPLAEIELGMDVEVFFAPTEGGLGVPLFRPVART
jgi:uncharacterized OB-fold protein